MTGLIAQISLNRAKLGDVIVNRIHSVGVQSYSNSVGLGQSI